MLLDMEIKKSVSAEDYNKLFPELVLKLGALQRKARELKIPVIILFEGLEASGKGTLINDLIQSLDPRGFRVHSVNPSNEEEALRPFLWRFWIKTPAQGRISIFDRSWYQRVLLDRVEGNVGKEVWKVAYHEIKSFERQLTDDGVLIVKLWLHIEKKEQKKRFEKIESNSATSWRINADDWRQHKKYDEYIRCAEDMFLNTDLPDSKWNIIGAHDRKTASLQIYQTVIEKLEERVSKASIKPHGIKEPQKMEKIPDIIKKLDLSQSMTKEEYEKKLPKYQKKLFELEHVLYHKRIPLVVLYEGCDAAGKGGNIHRLTAGLDPRGYYVIPISAPTETEKNHHYLWRFWNEFPKAGHISIFDRTWYGRVLVERVEGFCSEEEWRRAYREINENEAHMASFGAIIVKFWLQIDKDEQLKRFQAREKDPNKQWKITEEDYRNREKWDAYQSAVNEMIYRTNTPYAPWTCIESNSKYFARIKALKTVIKAIERKL